MQEESSLPLISHSYSPNESSLHKRNSSKISIDSTDIAAATSFSNSFSINKPLEQARLQNQKYTNSPVQKSSFSSIEIQESPPFPKPDASATVNNFHNSINIELWENSRFKNSFYSPEASNSCNSKYNRFLFFSEITGLVKSTYFEKLQFSTPIPTLILNKFWLHCHQPSPSEMNILSSIFGIHPLTNEDILTQDTREKCELFPNYYYICAKTFDEALLGSSYMQSINFSMVVFRDFILTFANFHVEHPENVLKRIDQLKSYGLEITPDWINYALMDDIIDSFIPVLRGLDIEVESIDDLVLILKENEQSDMLRRIGHARKKVMQLMKLLATKSDILKVVIHRCIEKMDFDNDTRFYLSDIQDHVIAMHENLMQHEKTLSRAHSNYLAQISIEITQSSNRTSDVVMKMTAIASILVPLNVITGLWGMNVKVPGQDVDSLYWFFSIILGMSIFATCTFYIFTRAKLV